MNKLSSTSENRPCFNSQPCKETRVIVSLIIFYCLVHSSLVFFLSLLLSRPLNHSFLFGTLHSSCEFPQRPSCYQKRICRDLCCAYFKLQLGCNTFLLMDSWELFVYPITICSIHSLPLTGDGVSVVCCLQLPASKVITCQSLTTSVQKNRKQHSNSCKIPLGAPS